MAIPEGYRLLTNEDVGKVFGVDLENTIYFDTSKEITNTSYATFLTLHVEGFTSNPNIGGKSTRVDITYAGDYTTIWTTSSAYDLIGWQIESFDIRDITSQYNISIYSYDTPNDWIYVKDIQEETTNDPYTITIKNKSGITLLVEGKYLTKDITILLDKSLFGESGEEEGGGGESGGTNTWSVEAISGASYGFTLNSSGYYESKNKGVNSTYAICKVNLDIKSDCKMYVDCINYAESSYDYGLLSKLDTTLTTSTSADSTNVFKSFKNLQSSNVVTVDYGTITAGSHFIYVKFIKDSSQNKNYDTLQFKVRLE